MIGRVGAACERLALCAGPLAVAVSGGVDSVVLLHLLHRLGFEPTVLSCDHGLRSGSVDELAFVRGLADDLGLPCRTASLGLSAGSGAPQRARAARLAWLSGQGFDAVALGHHRDDQVELVIDRLARGAGAGGLAGMSERRGVFVRPLLAASRAEILAYARRHELSWMEDPSNAGGTRGQLRHRVIPALEAARPGARVAVARAAQRLREDQDYLQERAMTLVSADGVPADAPPALARRALIELVRSVAGGLADTEARHLDAALSLGEGGVVQLPGGLRIVRDGGLRVLPASPGPRVRPAQWGLWSLRAPVDFSVRSVAPGERGGGCSLRDRLRAARIPPHLRDLHPVVEVGEARWLVGVWESGKLPPGVRVEATRPPWPCVPGAGPFTWCHEAGPMAG